MSFPIIPIPKLKPLETSIYKHREIADKDKIKGVALLFSPFISQILGYGQKKRDQDSKYHGLCLNEKFDSDFPIWVQAPMTKCCRQDSKKNNLFLTVVEDGRP